MKNIIIPSLLAVFFISACSPTGTRIKTVKKVDANGYAYEEVESDPLKTRIYTLKNGLKVFLSPNADEPRVTCLVGVRAGSTSDPAETTGLAHYFEHMMFKGTSRLGTINWEEESKLIEQIEALYEQHRATSDPAEKKSIYQQIDQLSQEAAKYVATNEYDKLMSSIGAKSTNAGTWYESTVYINDVPVNELERWAILESERFKGIVLRLFHTELETVYEEFNMYQDRDSERASIAMMKSLFPTHPYGRDVIGYPEHLKNPSMINIQNFFKTWYVPNNMAITLSGDINFESTIQLIDKYFGSIESSELPERSFAEEAPLTSVKTNEVVGPEPENITLAWRMNGIGSEDQLYGQLIDMILCNSQAGLIDLDLVQQQKVLDAGSSLTMLKDYGFETLTATPLQGQTLEQLEQLLLAEIEKIKKGEFDDWLIKAVINDLKLSRMRQQERNMGRAYELIEDFINGLSRQEALEFMAKLETVTKDQLVQFANKTFSDNYVVVYKRQGENSQLVKVDKPVITPVPVNRDLQSEFARSFLSMKSPDVAPVFVDYNQSISKDQLQQGCDLYYIRNQSNDLFSLRYIIDMGSWHNLEFELAVGYLRFIGTDKFSAPDLQKELYKYGLDFDVNTDNERSYVTIRGLNSSFDKGIELLEHILAHAQADQQSYNDYVDRILKERQDQKADQDAILGEAMISYGLYGSNNPKKNILSEEQLRAINPEALTRLIHDITGFKHMAFYYGPSEFSTIKSKLKAGHRMPEILADIPQPRTFVQIRPEQSQVYVVDFDINQANILLTANTSAFSKDLIAPARIYNNFYGAGLSSVVFQEIRESKALAYSAYSFFRIARKADRLNTLMGYVGTQADKLPIATESLIKLLNDMPMATDQYNMSREAIVKVINTERITKEQIFWNWLENRDKGIDYDIRKDIYEAAKNMDIQAFADFFNQQIKGQKYTYLILGKKNSLNTKALQTLGKVEDLSLEELFGY